MNDSRFVIATHVLTVLAAHPEAAKSCSVAQSVNTNPVVVRRVLGQLAKAGLVRCTPGATGGCRLLRSADQITLREIHQAVGESEIFAMHHRPPNQQCYIGANIQAALQPVLDAATECIANELSKTTLADILARVEAARPAACGNLPKPSSAAPKSRGQKGATHEHETQRQSGGGNRRV